MEPTIPIKATATTGNGRFRHEGVRGLTPTAPQYDEEEDMRAGREHYERRIAQQRAADKRRVERKQDIDWKKEEY